MREPRTGLGWKFATLIIVGLLVVGAAGGLVAALVTTREYTSTATVFAATPDLPDSVLNDGNTFVEARVQSYTDFASSPAVMSAVIEKLHLSESQTTLAQDVTATAPPNKVLIDLSVRNTSASMAQQICAAVTDAFIAAVEQAETGSRKSSPVTLTAIRPASLPTAPSSPQKSLDIAAGGLVGVVLGLLVIWVRTRVAEQLARRPQPSHQARADA